ARSHMNFYDNYFMAKSQTDSSDFSSTEISGNNIDYRTSNNVSVARKQKRAEAERKLNLKIREGFAVLYNVLPHHLARNKMSKANLLQNGVHLYVLVKHM
ncbi:5032_t:CDS:2, partial [Dentiscutata heterogama]